MSIHEDLKQIGGPAKQASNQSMVVLGRMVVLGWTGL
jgi:hypothetical protein